MADPLTAIATLGVGAIGMGATIACGGLQAKGAMQQGIATLKQNYYQAGVARVNASIAEQNKEWSLNQGELQAQQYGIGAREKMGAIRAGLGASGLDVRTGSAADVQKSQDVLSHTDLATIRSNAAKVAYDYDVQALQYEDQAKLYEMAGTNAASAGQINAQASTVGTVANVASKWMQGSQVGMFSPSNISAGFSDITSTVGVATGIVSPFGNM